MDHMPLRIIRDYKTLLIKMLVKIIIKLLKRRREK